MAVVFSSSWIRPEAREAAWRAVASEHFPGLRVVDAAPGLRVTLASSALGTGGRVAQLAGSALRVRREARRDATAETWKLLAQRRGRCRVRRGGETVVLDAGAFVAIDGRDDFELELESGYAQWLVQLPRELVLARAPHLARVPLVVSSAGAGDRAFLRVVQQAARAATIAPPDDAVAHSALLDVVCAALPLAESLRPPASPAGTYARARLAIERFAHDPRFGPAELAARVGASRRHVEQAFAARGATVARAIWDARLARCARELGEAASGHRGVLEIAAAHGFTSAAHFARRFRARYGQSPSAYRRARAR